MKCNLAGQQQIPYNVSQKYVPMAMTGVERSKGSTAYTIKNPHTEKAGAGRLSADDMPEAERPQARPKAGTGKRIIKKR